MQLWRLIVAFLFLFCTHGCNSGPDPVLEEPVGLADSPSSYSTLRPGSYSDGPEYEQIQKILKNAPAKVRIDIHQGIEWFDNLTRIWQTQESIENLRHLMETIEVRSVVTVGLGKASWDKEDEYVGLISEYAREAGFEVLVVTSDNSSDLVVSEVMHY